jgi:hypothetical protein
MTPAFFYFKLGVWQSAVRSFTDIGFFISELLKQTALWIDALEIDFSAVCQQ